MIKLAPTKDTDSFFHAHFYGYGPNGGPFQLNGFWWVLGTCHEDVNELAKFTGDSDDGSLEELAGGRQTPPSKPFDQRVPTNCFYCPKCRLSGDGEWVESAIGVRVKWVDGWKAYSFGLRNGINIWNGHFHVETNVPDPPGSCWASDGKWSRSDSKATVIDLPMTYDAMP